jgi:hypothetical protein
MLHLNAPFLPTAILYNIPVGYGYHTFAFLAPVSNKVVPRWLSRHRYRWIAVLTVVACEHKGDTIQYSNLDDSVYLLACTGSTRGT